MATDTPAFDDLLTRSGPSRSPSSSPTAHRTTFFGTEEELSNPFADLESTQTLDPPTPTSDALPQTPVEEPPLPTPSAETSQVAERRRPLPLQSPPQSTEVESPSVEEPIQSGLSRGSSIRSTASEVQAETPGDRVLVSPFDSDQHADSLAAAALPPRTASPPTPAILPPPSTASVSGENTPSAAYLSHSSSFSGHDGASIRTVGLESDAASTRTAGSMSTVAVALRDEAAKQGLLVTVGDPQKMGSELTASAHIVYTVHTRVLGGSSSSFRKTDFSVLRRFSHFLWLYETLTANNPGVIVPSPPEKAALGRFSNDFVEARRHALQNCLQRIVNHPMLVSDPDLRLFLESDTLSVDIKHRKAESAADRPGFLASLSSSVISPRYQEADEFFTARKTALDSLEPQLRGLQVSLHTSTKARQALSASTSDLSAAVTTLAALTHALPRPAREALIALSALKKRAHELEEEQVAAEMAEASLTSTVDSYLRLCTSIRLAAAARLKSHATWQRLISAAQALRAQHDRARARGAPPYPDALNELADAERRAEEAKREFDDVSKLFKAEMVRFDVEKVDDFKRGINEHVDGMIIRQKQVVASWTAYTNVCQTAAASNANANAMATTGNAHTVS